MRRIAVLAASGRELAPVRAVFGFFKPVQRRRLGSFRYDTSQVGGVELYLIETGIGPERAREAAEAALVELAPDALISTGYAGALGVAALGEVILGTRFLDWSKERSRPVIQADPALLDSARMAAREARIAWTQGSVVTVDRVVWRATEKQALGETSGAIAVDMESAIIARVATSAGIPFLLARAISDRVGDDLPMDFNVWFPPFGSFRCLLKILQRPSILRGLYRMNRRANRASDSLRKFFCALVIVLESHCPSPDSEISLSAGAR